MVSKFVTGKSIKGALNYNEKKVAEGKAELLHAEKYLKDAAQLSFSERLFRLEHLAEMNERIKTNCVHISLNFDPSETLSNEKLVSIAQAYMDKVGFGGQPFLVYRHTDAGHPHVHIVSTQVQANGIPIPLHNIGRDKSEKARKEIEKIFGLVPAASKKQQQQSYLQPVAEKVTYGKSETKAAVSNVVRAVVRDYKFSSLAELNAVLNQYNITAYRGEEGTAMFEKKGLVYSVLDGKGNKMGVPIKASSIYSKPTLPRLERMFENNKERKLPCRQRLKNIIDKTVGATFIPDKQALKDELQKQNISVVYRQNETMVYGITYIDNGAKAVFTGSDLGKEYSAKRMLERIGFDGLTMMEQQIRNKQLTDKATRSILYSRGIGGAIASLYKQGLRIKTAPDEKEGYKYLFGHRNSSEYSYCEADKGFCDWLRRNKISPSLLNRLNKEAEKYLKDEKSSSATISIAQHVGKFIQNVLAPVPIDMPAPVINQGSEKKKKRRRPNW